MTLDQCISLAYQNSPELRAAEAFVQEAEGERARIRGQFLPNVQLSSLIQKQSQPPVPLSFPGIRPSFSSKDVWAHDLSARQTLFAWGGVRYQYESAGDAQKVSQQSLRLVRQELKARVRRAFYDLLLAREKVRIEGEAESVARSHFDTTSARFREAKSTSFEASQSKVFWINRRTELIRSRNQVRMAETALRKVVGLPFEEAPLELDGAIAAQPSVQEFEALRKEMLENRPQLKRMELETRQRESLIRVARAAHRPTVTASYTRTWQDVTLRRSFDRYNDWNAVGQINFPLFDGFSSWGRVASAEAALAVSKANQKGELDSSRLELQEAVLRAQDGAERIQAQQENVQTAEANVRIAERRLRLGTISYIEMKDAQLSQTEAEANYLQALYDYAVALVDIDRIVGRD